MRTAIAYIRVSTDDQHLGPEAQRGAIEAWAARQGVQVTAWLTDKGVSGAAPLDERPGLLAAMAALDGADYLVVAKRDRLARDVLLALMLDRLVTAAGAQIISTDGVTTERTPEGELMRGLLDLFAQYERAMIRARTKAALEVKRARGEKLGGLLPFGYRSEAGRLVPEAGEQAVIARIRELAAAGHTQRAIVAELAAAGLKGRKGPLGKTQVQRILAQ